MSPEVLVVVSKLSRRINREVLRLRRMEDLVSKTGQELDGLPRSQTHSSMIEKIAVSIVDTRNLVTKLLEIRTACRVELTALLENLIGDFEAECQTLIYRYAYEFAFVSIAERLDYSRSSVYRFHREGLELLGFDGDEIRLLEADDF